jgi:phosphocarrier protein
VGEVLLGHEAGFVVQSGLGVLARPAGECVALADRFDAVSMVGGGGEWVGGGCVLSVLSLAAGRGTRLCLRAVGPDARAAVEALGALLERASASD